MNNFQKILEELQDNTLEEGKFKSIKSAIKAGIRVGKAEYKRSEERQAKKSEKENTEKEAKSAKQKASIDAHMAKAIEDAETKKGRKLSKTEEEFVKIKAAFKYKE